MAGTTIRCLVDSRVRRRGAYGHELQLPYQRSSTRLSLARSAATAAPSALNSVVGHARAAAYREHHLGAGPVGDHPHRDVNDLTRFQREVVIEHPEVVPRGEGEADAFRRGVHEPLPVDLRNGIPQYPEPIAADWPGSRRRRIPRSAGRSMRSLMCQDSEVMPPSCRMPPPPGLSETDMSVFNPGAESRPSGARRRRRVRRHFGRRLPSRLAVGAECCLEGRGRVRGITVRLIGYVQRQGPAAGVPEDRRAGSIGLDPGRHLGHEVRVVAPASVLAAALRVPTRAG